LDSSETQGNSASHSIQNNVNFIITLYRKHFKTIQYGYG